MMASTKKIFVDKHETAEDLLKRILTARETDIVIVVPRDAALKKSLKNFHSLKSESTAAEKNIVIETVDDEVLAFAKASGIDASHSLFRDGAHRMSDIVPRGAEKKSKEEIEEDEEVRESDTELPGAFRKKAEAERFFGEEDSESRRKPRRRIMGTKRSVAVVAIVVLLAASFVALGHFAKATISLHLKRMPYSYDGDLTVTPQVSAIDVAKGQIPGELFTNQKNFTQLFPATGHTDTSAKAKGTMTVWNAYSSAAQTLVATTRFQTPDGKLFRLDKTITVPGAHVSGGKITPSSVDAAVTADQPGPDSNVGAVAKLTIPGFKGTPRYGGFYGELKSGTSGGASGAHAVATADDVAQAKAKAQDVLTADLKSLAIASVPDGFVIPDGATDVAVTKISVNDQTDDKGNFSVFAEATIRAIGFRKSDLAALLVADANQNAPYRENLSGLTTNFTNLKPDYEHGTLAFHVSASGDAVPAFVSSTFLSNIAGKTEGEARTAILAIPGLVDGKISLWPIWESRIPNDMNRVTMQVN